MDVPPPPAAAASAAVAAARPRHHRGDVHTTSGVSAPTTPAHRLSSSSDGGPATTPTAEASTPTAGPGGSDASSSRTPPPSGSSKGKSTESADAGPTTSAPCTPTDPPSRTSPYQTSATPSGPSSRPPLAGGPGAAGRSASVGRTGPGSRPPASRTNPANMPPAGRPSGLAAGSRLARDASPQRRAVGGSILSTPSSSTAAAAVTPLRAASTSGSATATAAAATPQPSRTGLVTAGPSHQPDAFPSELTSERSNSHLPLAAQRALQAAAVVAADKAGGPTEEADAGGRAPGPPQLPVPLRRAMQRYRETLATRDELLKQHQHRAGGRNGGTATLADMVAAAGRSYCSALARQYPDAAAVADPEIQVAGQQLQRLSLASPGGIRGTRPQPNPAELRRRAQVVFAALVAAQTWLCQSLAELARTRGMASGAGAAAQRRATQADTCAALLAEVDRLRLELREVQAKLAAAAQPPEPPVAAAPTHGKHDPPGSARAATAAAWLDQDDEASESAALWRNRFLRAILGDVGAPAAGGGAGVSRASRSGHLVRQSGLAAQAQQTAAPQGAIACMPRPLGVWLPDAMWTNALALTPLTGSTSGQPTPSSSTPTSPLPLPPPNQPAPAVPAGVPAAPLWHSLLPSRPVAQPSQHFGGAMAPANGPPQWAQHAAPPALQCASLQDAVAHGRAQLQLQATLFQLLLESSLAAPVLPRQRRPQAQPAMLGAGGQSSGRPGAVQAAVAWERWLAQCRLAHLLLFKGAWNRLCSVVELEEEGEEQGLEATAAGLVPGR